MPGEPVVVARIVRAHGIEGGLLVLLETDHPEVLFVRGRELRVLEPPAGAPERLTLTEAAAHGTGWRLIVEEIADRGAAQRLQGVLLAVDEEALPPLEEDEYFLHDLVGLEVIEADRRLGRVDEVYELPGGPMLGVDFEGRERLIPFRREIVEEVDLDRRLLRVTLPEGLLDV